jgi:collagenase-like PrtC family protease
MSRSPCNQSSLTVRDQQYDRRWRPTEVLLEDGTRPGEYMSAYEDEHGTYIMNSKDLRAVQHVERWCRWACTR